MHRPIRPPSIRGLGAEVVKCGLGGIHPVGAVALQEVTCACQPYQVAKREAGAKLWMLVRADMGEANTDEEAPRASKTLHYVGYVITGDWLAGLASYTFANFDAISRLPANAHGDFAAGAFAPLAFLWLVLGFFQQGEELR